MFFCLLTTNEKLCYSTTYLIANCLKTITVLLVFTLNETLNGFETKWVCLKYLSLYSETSVIFKMRDLLIKFISFKSNKILRNPILSTVLVYPNDFETLLCPLRYIHVLFCFHDLLHTTPRKTQKWKTCFPMCTIVFTVDWSKD